jgi:hypothetical protein
MITLNPVPLSLYCRSVFPLYLFLIKFSCTILFPVPPQIPALPSIHGYSCTFHYSCFSVTEFFFHTGFPREKFQSAQGVPKTGFIRLERDRCDLSRLKFRSLRSLFFCASDQSYFPANLVLFTILFTLLFSYSDIQWIINAASVQRS